MSPAATFYERDDLQVLTADAFDFVLEREIQRAIRSQSYLTLVTVGATRPWGELTMPADDHGLEELAGILRREVRSSDLLGHIDAATLAMALLDTDIDSSGPIIERLAARIGDYQFTTPIDVEFGVACDPTHAVDATLLKRHARSHPTVRASGHAISSASA